VHRAELHPALRSAALVNVDAVRIRDDDEGDGCLLFEVKIADRWHVVARHCLYDADAFFAAVDDLRTDGQAVVIERETPVPDP